MMKRYMGAAVAALSLLTTSTAFAASPVRPASVLQASSGASFQRASTKVTDKNQLVGIPLVALFAGIAAVVAVIVVVADDSPTSP